MLDFTGFVNPFPMQLRSFLRRAFDFKHSSPAMFHKLSYKQTCSPPLWCWLLDFMSTGLLLLRRLLRLLRLLRRTSTASASSQRSPPDPNSKLRIRAFPAGPQLQAIRVFPAGPQLQALAARSQCSPPDPNSKLRIRAFPAGPRPQRSSKEISDKMPERRSESTSDRMANRMSEYMSIRISVGGDLRCERDAERDQTACPMSPSPPEP